MTHRWQTLNDECDMACTRCGLLARDSEETSEECVPTAPGEASGEKGGAL